MKNEPQRVVKVRLYIAGVLVAEEEVSGPLSTKCAKPGKQGGRKG